MIHHADTQILILSTILHSISAISCVWFFYCYAKLKKKTPGLKMVLILCISDFIFHVTFIANQWIYPSFETRIRTFINDTSFRFSIFWPASIACLTYRSLGNFAIGSTEQYITGSF